MAFSLTRPSPSVVLTSSRRCPPPLNAYLEASARRPLPSLVSTVCDVSPTSTASPTFTACHASPPPAMPSHTARLPRLQGINRSAAIVVAYMMIFKRWPLIVALQRVNHARPAILGNVGFREQLIEFAQCNGLLIDAEAAPEPAPAEPESPDPGRPADAPSPTPPPPPDAPPAKPPQRDLPARYVSPARMLSPARTVSPAPVGEYSGRTWDGFPRQGSYTAPAPAAAAASHEPASEPAPAEASLPTSHAEPAPAEASLPTSHADSAGAPAPAPDPKPAARTAGTSPGRPPRTFDRAPERRSPRASGSPSAAASRTSPRRAAAKPVPAAASPSPKRSLGGARPTRSPTRARPDPAEPGTAAPKPRRLDSTRGPGPRAGGTPKAQPKAAPARRAREDSVTALSAGRGKPVHAPKRVAKPVMRDIGVMTDVAPDSRASSGSMDLSSSSSLCETDGPSVSTTSPDHWAPSSDCSLETASPDSQDSPGLCALPPQPLSEAAVDPPALAPPASDARRGPSPTLTLHPTPAPASCRDPVPKATGLAMNYPYADASLDPMHPPSAYPLRPEAEVPLSADYRCANLEAFARSSAYASHVPTNRDIVEMLD